MSLDDALTTNLYWLWLVIGTPLIYTAGLMLCFGVVILLLSYVTRIGKS